MSNWLGEQIKKRNGILKLNSPVVNIIQTEDKCIVITKSEEKFEGDYVIIAMPPCNVKTINFSPSLSAERKLICEKSFMGTIIKVIILYKERYWKNKGFTGESLSDCFDSPVMNGFDDTRVN
jgi:monoamine oxidase